MAEKWMARVVISPEETQFFKFQEQPTQDEIDAVTTEFLARRQEMNDGPTE
jgi:hypothetical protein